MLYSADGLSMLLPGPTEHTDDAMQSKHYAEFLADLVDTANATGEDRVAGSIVFVDSRVADSDHVVDRLQQSGAEVVLIAIDEDGLLVISQTLAEQTDIAAVHVISHGSAGELSLGNARLNAESLAGNAVAVAAWGDALTEDADILLYGCDLASTAAGQTLVQSLAATTGADVAASVDLTGHVNAGGDWDLEYRSGSIAADQEIAELLAADWAHSLAIVNVSTFDDVYDAPDLSSIAALLADPGADGNISLREAITAANNTAGADHINLMAGTYDLTVGGSDDNNSGGDLDIRDDLTLAGDDSSNTVVRMTNNYRVVDIHGATVSVSDITITGGNWWGNGGGLHVRPGSDVTLTDVVVDSNNTSMQGAGIYNQATLTLINTTISNNTSILKGGGIANTTGASLSTNNTWLDGNRSSFDSGGGIHNKGAMNLVDTAVSSGYAKKDGGGIHNQGQAVLERVTVNGNTADNKGGGISHSGGGSTLSLLNVTVSGNQALEGGGIRVVEDISIVNSTIVQNTTTNGDGGLWIDGGAQANVGNTILADNTSSNGSANTSGNFVSQGFNLFSDSPVTDTVLGTTDIVNQNPNLGPLVLGSGMVATHVPLAGSPVINAGGTVGHTADARGENLNEIADIGAVEYEAPAGVVYWTNGANNVYRADAGLSNAQIIVGGRTQLVDIEVDLQHGRIYMLEGDGTGLYSTQLDGTDLIAVLPGLANATGFALDAAAGHAYVAVSNGGAGSIWRYNLIGAPLPVQLVSGLVNPRDIEIDLAEGRISWIDAGTGVGDGSVSSADLAGGAVVTHAAASGPASLAVALDTQALIWTEPAASQLWSVTSSVANPATSVNTTVTTPTGVTYDELNDRLIWTSSSNNSIVTSDVALTTESVLLASTPNPVSIAYGATSPTGAPPVINVNAGTSVSEGGTITIATANLGVTDADTAANLVTIDITDDVDNGQLELLSNPGARISQFTQAQLDAGQVVYVHDGSETATDSFYFALSDGSTTLDPIEFQINISPVSDNAPVGGADSLTVAEGGVIVELDSSALTVLDNDTDADLPGDTLTVTAFSQGTYGTVIVNTDGKFSYTHDGSENFSDSFTYTVDDGAGGSDTVTVSVVITPVNDNSPIGAADALSVVEGGTTGMLDSTALTVLANDTDADLPGDTLTVTAFSQGTYGTVTVNADGTFSYAHDGSENFSDAFTYTVDDGAGGSDTVTVSVVIIPANDNSPVGIADSITVNEGASISVLDSGASSLLGNDTDSDLPNDTLAITGFTQPAHGLVSVDAAGAFTYAHDGSEHFLDSFTYTVEDLAGHSDTVTVSVAVNPVNDNSPVGLLDSLTVQQGGSSSVLDSGGGSLLVNDTDPDLPNDSLTVFGHTDGSFGTVVVDANGAFTYTHDGSENYTDAFLYLVQDAAGNTEFVNVTVSIIPSNEFQPIANPDSLAVDEGGLATSLNGGFATVLHNDSDADLPDDSLIVSLSQPAQHGTLQLAADGTFVYAHDGSETLTDSFTYVVTDAGGKVSAEAEVSIVISGVNDAPQLQQALADQLAVEDEPFALIIAPVTYLDPDTGDQITVRLQTASGEALPEWLSFDPVTGTLSGTPGNSDVGSIKLRVDAVDLHGATGQAFEFALTVENVNSAPVGIALDANQVDENISGAQVGMLTAMDADAGDTVRLSVSDPRFSIVDDVLFLQPDEKLDFEAEAEIKLTITATDAAGAESSQSFTLHINDANDNPDLATALVSANVPADGSLVVPADTFVDEDGDSLVYSAVQANGESLPAWLAFEPSTREFSLLAAADATEELRVMLIADDGRGGQASVPLTLKFTLVAAAAEPAEPTPVNGLPELTELSNTASSTQVNKPVTPVAEAANVAEVAASESAQVAGDDSALVEFEIAAVDLSSLIKPLPRFESMALEAISSIVPAAAHLEVARDMADAIDTFDLSELLGLQEQNLSRVFGNLVDTLDEQREAMDNAASFAQTLVGTSATVTSGLTVGYLIWLIRGGTLMGSVLSSLPAWRLVDPLPVLASLTDEVDDDDESLQTMVDTESQPTSTADSTKPAVPGEPDQPQES